MSARRIKPAAQLDLAVRGVVLAVDTARISGWALRLGPKLRYSGEVDTLHPEAVQRVCQLALDLTAAAYLTRRPVLVLESPWGGRVNVLVALGQARERWLAAWAAVGMPRARVVSVQPSSWRARVLGRGAVRLDREAIRARERLSAQAEVAPGMRDAIGPDEAAAILISRWAVRAPVVARMHGVKT